MANITVRIRPENIDKKIGRVNLKKSLEKAVAIVAKRLEAGGKKKTTEMIYEQPISRSGYQRTGWLRKSIISESQGLKGKVKAMAEYSEYVHEGTRFMRSRPFFTKAVEELQNELEKETGKIIEVSIENQIK